ncbi:MAG TPA: archaellin/type IV pilin N-terminal domain-containing protein [Thermoplasmata archaeon]|nr:archaellin/type IV pilin N-terminal domain-containing protein [Thermoplasmata archaeon]
MNAKRSKIRAARAQRRKSKRGVSPIIATILLVAITVVLAAVLYVLVSGLTKTGANVPYTLGMNPSSQGGSGSTWTDVLALSPTSGLTTTAFGLKVTTPSSTVFPTVAASGSGCSISATTNLPSSCTGTAGGWYGVLTSPSTGYIVALWSGASAGWTYASGTTIALNNGYQLWIVTAIQVAGNSYTLSAYSTGSSSVSGQCLL